MLTRLSDACSMNFYLLLTQIAGNIVHPKELEQKHQESKKTVLNTIADIPVLPKTEFYEQLRDGLEKVRRATGLHIGEA